jgi:hypothetical protein
LSSEISMCSSSAGGPARALYPAARLTDTKLET